MSESLPVEIRFNPDGTLRPTAFEWKGQRYNIESLGRQWEENGAYHFLVLVADDQVFELVFLQAENQWQLRRSPRDFKGHSFV